MRPDRSHIPTADATRADPRTVVFSRFIAHRLARVRARTVDTRVSNAAPAVMALAARRHRDTAATCIVIITSERGGPGRGVDILLHTMDTRE